MGVVWRTKLKTWNKLIPLKVEHRLTYYRILKHGMKVVNQDWHLMKLKLVLSTGIQCCMNKQTVNASTQWNEADLPATSQTSLMEDEVMASESDISYVPSHSSLTSSDSYIDR